MNALQRYVFREVMGPLAAILAALTAIAMLTQSLNQLDIIIDQKGSALSFLWITILSTPQVLSLIVPIAVFFAVAYAINRLQSDSELAVAFAAGVSPAQIIKPVFRLAVVIAVLHLASNVMLQPASYRELRETIYSIRGDLAASLVREGAFTEPSDGLTLYARSTDSRGQMRDVFIQDGRNPARPVTYTARRGAAAMVEGHPALVLRQGQITQPKEDGAVDLLDFDQYVLEIGDFLKEPDAMVLKPSDRFLAELFYPNLTSYYDQRNIDRFIAEAHSRLSAPLLDIALALIALAGLITGDFNRRGYGVRMGVSAVIALFVRLLALAIQSAARETPQLNALQYVLPLLVIVLCMWIMVAPFRRGRARKPPAHAREGAWATA